ncbi:MAG: nucleoside deaminase [Streptococcaceae bacterium]|jgi:tRNA(adenine34) deaminase|nr:nucleoside deaminase [Streptococcaceae bacterium]
MYLALKEAKKAECLAEVPIGAIIVQDKKVIASGYNLREKTRDATTHAEMTAIRSANKVLDNWRIENAAIFITVEPCAMCSGALLLSRISKIYFGAYNAKGGSAGTVIDLFNISVFNHTAYVEGGILEKECAKLMSNFFYKKR